MIGRGADEVLIALRPSPFRRWVAIGVFVGLGVVLVWVALQGARAPLWQAFFLVAGLGVLWMSDVLRRSSRGRLELTREVLRSDRGRILARVEDIRSVERGAFAFKPSNGFLVRLRTPGARAWVPGLWWRVGTFVGVGGVVSPGEAKAMADILSALHKGILPEDPD